MLFCVILCLSVPLLQLGADYCTPSDFLIYVLVFTAQTTKSMKTNDIPLKSPIKLQQEMQKKFSKNLKAEALLKVSFKNVDWFQKYKAWKIGKFEIFLAFLVAII